MTRTSARLLSPFAFALCVPVVGAIVLATVVVMESMFELHTWRRMGDIDGSIALVISGIAVFGSCTNFLARLECIENPGVSDHFRHTSLVYIVAFTSGAWLARNFSWLNGAVQYAYGVAIFSAAIFAIFVNGIALTLRRWRGTSAA